MTIDQANDLVRALIGEDDYHYGADAFMSYYDIAQKQIATTVSPIKKSFTITGPQVVTMPQDMYRLTGCDKSYRKIDDTHIEVEEHGDTNIRYFAYPCDITPQTPVETSFEVSSEAQNAIPYFAAAHAVLADSDMRRYYAFMDMYNNILQNISAQDSGASILTIIELGDK